MSDEWKGQEPPGHRNADGFAYDGKTYESLSKIARLITGSRWNGPRFFGLRSRHDRNGCKPEKPLRCAIYTRKSTEHGLELEFNSLDAQREACEAYIKSQASEGWSRSPGRYDDPAYSGGNLDRPALQKLLKDIEAGQVDVVVVYKIDRLTRSLADFAKLVEIFDASRLVRRRHPAVQHHDLDGPADPQRASVLCSVRAGAGRPSACATRSRPRARKGKWTGGSVPLGYDVKDKKLVVNPAEARPSA